MSSELSNISSPKCFYLWYFKPGEKQRLPFGAMNSNIKFLPNTMVVTPQNADKFLEECATQFPDLRLLYAKIPQSHWVIRTDLLRLVTVYLYGGFYSDIDCFIRKWPLPNSNSDQGVELFTESILSSVKPLGPRESHEPNRVVRVANFFFGCNRAKHPFFADCINECLRRLTQLFVNEQKTNVSNTDILWVCGPDVITTIYHEKKHLYKDVHLHPMGIVQHKCFSSWR